MQLVLSISYMYTLECIQRLWDICILRFLMKEKYLLSFRNYFFSLTFFIKSLSIWTISQSFNQSISQSVNLSISQSINQSISQSVNSVNQTIRQCTMLLKQQQKLVVLKNIFSQRTKKSISLQIKSIDNSLDFLLWK